MSEGDSDYEEVNSMLKDWSEKYIHAKKRVEELEMEVIPLVSVNFDDTIKE